MSDESDLTGDTIDRKIRDLAWKRVGRMTQEDTLQILSAFACKFHVPPSDLVVIFIATIIKSSQATCKISVAAHTSVVHVSNYAGVSSICLTPLADVQQTLFSRSVRPLFSKNFSRFYQIRFDISIA